MKGTAQRLRHAIFACLATVSCSGEQKQMVVIGSDGDRFTLTLQTGTLEGLCYAPQSIVPNGSLNLDGFDRPDSWKTVSTVPARIEGLGDILSAPRTQIGSDGLTLAIPKDAVIKRPFDLQFVAFPCNAPRAVKPGIGTVRIISITADLPPFAGDAAIGTTPG